MPTTILLIENDAGFAREITEALEGAGYQVRVTGDGKEGLDLAHEVTPAAIVLCVELPKMSGYSICQKLKKDDALKGIPLILTSAEATAETFEQHKKLKARAEDYLLKPYAPTDLLSLLAPLTGQPEAAAEEDGGEVEVVSLEEELGLEMLAGEAEGDLPALDLDSLPDEPAPGGATGQPASAGGEDEDLRLLDDAFAGLSSPPPTSPVSGRPPSRAEERPSRDAGAELDLALEGDRPVGADEVEAAAASMPPEEEEPDRSRFAAMSDEADLALGALGGDGSRAAALDALDALNGPSDGLDDEPPAAPPPLDFAPELAAALDLAPDAPAAQVRGAAADALRAAGIALLDEPPPPSPPTLKVVPPLTEPSPARAPSASGADVGRLEVELADRRAALAARDAELRGLHDRIDALTHRAVDAESALAEREAEVASTRARAEALTAQVKRAEADLKAGRDEARKVADQLRAAEDRARAAEGQASAAEAKVSAAAEKARAAEAQASAAEARSAAAIAEAARHRASAAEAARSLEAKVTELAVATAAAARLEGVEREVEELKTELIVARGEVEGARSEVENRGAELKKRIGDLEAANAKNEERVVKAYLKIKGDEKVRDKARKALAIALQLLEEGLPPEQPGAARPTSPGAKLD
jgi:CheY-like chemotaxis protein